MRDDLPERLAGHTSDDKRTAEPWMGSRVDWTASSRVTAWPSSECESPRVPVGVQADQETLPTSQEGGT